MSDETFESHRPALLALAYRMLGDMARAEDMVQEAWLRWQGRRAEVDTPRAYLITMVTRLCLDDLTSPRARREESRGDRLPEPIDLRESGLDRLELLDQISMAFVVVLQRLTPAERAVLLLHEVFDMSHDEIAALLGKSEAACRQLLARARQNVTAERRVLHTSPAEHRRLLMAFVGALSGEEQPLVELLADDVVLIGDAGPDGGRFGKVRNVGRPVSGHKRVAAFIKALARQRVSPPAQFRERTLNGQPAVVAVQNGQPVLAILISVADGKIRHIFLQADPDRLTRLGAMS
ncbi:MAG: polymerase sigma-70 factor [Myxococcales bacterium]|nr:polymerase sigma-70 factor [Myxococcales bacterium]